MLEEMIISHQGKLYILMPNWESQCRNFGTLDSEQGTYIGSWWQMDAVDDTGADCKLCWYDENFEEDDDGSVALDYYKPDVILVLED